MTPWRRTKQPLLPPHAPPDATRGYRLFPSHDIGAGAITRGFPAVAAALRSAHRGRLIVDGNAAVDWDATRAALTTEWGDDTAWFDTRTAWRDPDDVARLLAPTLTDDALFGHRYLGTATDLFDPTRAALLVRRWRAAPGPAILFGPGAATLAGDPADARIAWLDVPKNEVQYRARANAARNWGASQPLDPKEAYKRSYFVDWVIEAEALARLLPRLDVFVDTQRRDDPTAIAGDALRAGLSAIARGPLRARPWFEPGAWGGTWLAGFIPDLPPERNYAWSFELIAPENGLLLRSGDLLLEVPFDLLLMHDPAALLGAHAPRFGAYFPIRFDYLDTIGGGNLSLQVHPTPGYARAHFGERVTQDETYYIARAEPDARVYLGFRDGVTRERFRAAVDASRGGAALAVEEFVQALPAARHDLFLIPHGTIHCSGRGALVLEISATPYIFTFKMYDWQRLDLDGKPRTINIERAFANLDFERRGAVVSDTLRSTPRVIDAGHLHRVVHLPTHPDHYYDVHRLELAGPLTQRVHGGVHVLNVVEGAGVRVRSADGVARTYHEAETFIVGAAAESYTIEPIDGAAKVVKAFLKETR